MIPRRQMVEAMLFIALLPERYGAWSVVWSQWRRWDPRTQNYLQRRLARERPAAK